MIRNNIFGKSGRVPLFLQRNRRVVWLVCLLVFVLSVAGLVGYSIWRLRQNASARNTTIELQNIREDADSSGQLDEPTEEAAGKAPEILQKYKELYVINSDMAGWLAIEDTVIDYPVMQTMEDECYYLNRDFYGEKNSNGCLILDTDSTAGTGTKVCDYTDGTAPSTNLIIHGHTMKSGEMFGKLKLYADAEYGREHSLICFDSLYEEREYELIAVFYSQVYYESDDVFKYYKFFQADTQEEFDAWYENIKAMSLYDTGITARFGDEFITLSACSYHVEDGRFVVVGKRVK